MKQQLRNRNFNIIEHIDFVLFATILSSLFFYHRINGFLVMLLIIFSVLKIVFGKIRLQRIGGLFFLPAIFFLLVIGVSYSSNTEKGWELVGRNLALFMLPFATQSVLLLSVKNTQRLIRLFTASAFIVSIICLAVASLKAFELGTISVSANDSHFLYNVFMHHRLSEPFTLHAVYFSWYISFINLFILHHLIKSTNMKQKFRIGYLILFLFFCMMIYLLKSAMISFGFTFCALLIIIYTQGKTLWKTKQQLVLTISIFSLFILFSFFAVVSKIEDFSFAYDMSNPHLSTLGIRLSIWECSWAVTQDNWMLGIGTGDGQEALREMYQNRGFTIGAESNFNAHNMYLEYWMSNGILTVGLFCSLLIILFRKAIKAKNVLFLSFVILFVLFSFTESTMRTQKGLIFFVLLGSMFYWGPNLWMNPPEKSTT